ncbi:anti-H(O) lectin 1-like [Tripterygium wilfordii]|uniref:anti-H(O) lectin 1-like n=1 Tax=Tripterygium wilfordii TaxID=458696 RepID=UPI0018F80C9E|nr:anti-H(O) lectin 1-like [Tripterygium wilfordii]
MDGLTFIIAPCSSPSPSDSYGSYLGIMDPAQDSHAAGQLAVEFDTYKNTGDLDANHIAIVTKSVIHPIQARSLNFTGIDLKSGRDIKVLIVLDGRTKSIRVHIGYASDPIGETFLEGKLVISPSLKSFIPLRTLLKVLLILAAETKLPMEVKDESHVGEVCHV